MKNILYVLGVVLVLFSNKTEAPVDYVLVSRKITNKSTDFKASEGFARELDAIAYNNEEDFNFSADYRQMMATHYSEQAAELAKTETIEHDVVVRKRINYN
jgi:hypothetical protein